MKALKMMTCFTKPLKNLLFARNCERNSRRGAKATLRLFDFIECESRIVPSTFIVKSHLDGVTGTVLRTGDFGNAGRINVNASSGQVTSIVLSFANHNNALTSEGVDHRSLTDGFWQLSIPALNYKSEFNGHQLFRLLGDGNGNGIVDGSDSVLFGNAFNTNGVAFDFDDNGIVDGVDSTIFGNSFSNVLF